MKTPSGRDAHLAEEKKNILKYVQADSLRRYVEMISQTIENSRIAVII